MEIKKSHSFALLLDPEKANLEALRLTETIHPDYFLVGGSTGGDTTEFVRSLKSKLATLNVHVPIILFPGNAAQFTSEADAILYLSLLSGRNPEWLVGQQIKAARAICQSNIESIPTGYILIDGGVETSTMQITGTLPIPTDKIDEIVDTAIAAELMGKELIYLEAGSGAKVPVSSEIITAVRDAVSVPLMVGGGIRTPEMMNAAYAAGADIVVVGNHFEQHPDSFADFVSQLKYSEKLSEDERFMHLALLEAEKALALGEIPIGCIIVSQGRIIGRGHNLTEMLEDVTAHAEIQAITAAAQTLGGKYMPDATLYVTVEPCVMCAGAIGWAQIKRIVYGAADPKRGFATYAPRAFHSKATVIAGVLESECRELIQDFFRKKR